MPKAVLRCGCWALLLSVAYRIAVKQEQARKPGSFGCFAGLNILHALGFKNCYMDCKLTVTRQFIYGNWVSQKNSTVFYSALLLNIFTSFCQMDFGMFENTKSFCCLVDTSSFPGRNTLDRVVLIIKFIIFEELS